MSAWRKLITANVRELRFHFSQSSQGSKGLRYAAPAPPATTGRQQLGPARPGPSFPFPSSSPSGL